MHALTIGIVIIFITASLSHCIMLRTDIATADDASAYVHEAATQCRRLNFSGKGGGREED